MALFLAPHPSDAAYFRERDADLDMDCHEAFDVNSWPHQQQNHWCNTWYGDSQLPYSAPALPTFENYSPPARYQTWSYSVYDTPFANEYHHEVHGCGPHINAQCMPLLRHPSPEESMTIASFDSHDTTFSTNSSDMMSPSPSVASPSMHWSMLASTQSHFRSKSLSSYESTLGGVALRDIHPPQEGILKPIAADNFLPDPSYDIDSMDHDDTDHDTSHCTASTTHLSDKSLPSSSTSSVPLTPEGAGDEDSEYEPTHKKASRSVSRKTRANKVVKRCKIVAPTRRLLSDRKPTGKSLSNHNIKEEVSVGGGKDKLKVYTCPLRPYGCTADFSSKNEWKRHLTSQHLCDAFYRCDLCATTDKGPNDFNRKDLFTEHLRRMHFPKVGNNSSSSKTSKSEAGSEQHFDEIRQRCRVPLFINDLELSCAFCKEKFKDDRSCEKWIEHIAQHLTASAKNAAPHGNVPVAPWEADTILRDWLLGEGLIIKGNVADVWQLAGQPALLERRNQAQHRKEVACEEESKDADGDAEEEEED